MVTIYPSGLIKSVDENGNVRTTDHESMRQAGIDYFYFLDKGPPVK